MIELEMSGRVDGQNESTGSSWDEAEDECFTVDEAIEKIGFGKFQLVLSVFTGMIWMVDAMEIMIMSIIAPAAQCAFDLSDVEVAMISVVVFLGIMLGSPLWGWLTDKYGRHRCLLLSASFIGFYGAASAFSPNYFWLLALRFLAGFNLACTPQAMTYYSEFLPSSVRGSCVVFIEVFWSIGTVFETLLAMGVMPTLGWRYLLGFSSIPITLSVIVFMFFPESPHFLVTAGQKGKALAVLKTVAASNNKQLPEGRLVSVATKRLLERKRKLRAMTTEDGSLTASEVGGTPSRGEGSSLEGSFYPSEAEDDSLIYTVNPEDVSAGMAGCSQAVHGRVLGAKSNTPSIKDLFSTWKLGLSTILLGLIWFVLSFVYYGVSLMTVEVLEVDLVYTDANGTSHCVDELVDSNSTSTSCHLTSEQYVTILWTTAAEFPGLLITILLMLVLSRRNTIRLEFALVTLFYALLLKCDVSRTTTLLFIFGVRALITGVFQASYVYTPEVYPTRVRGMGLAFCSAVSRLGSMSTPFVAQVLLKRKLFAGKLVYTAVGGLGLLASAFLPIETKGKALS